MGKKDANLNVRVLRVSTLNVSAVTDMFSKLLPYLIRRSSLEISATLPDPEERVRDIRSEKRVFLGDQSSPRVNPYSVPQYHTFPLLSLRVTFVRHEGNGESGLQASFSLCDAINHFPSSFAEEY